MSPKKLLRIMVIAQWITLVVSVVVMFITEQHLPAELRGYLERVAEEPISSVFWISVLFLVLILVLYLVGSIGLFRFWKPSRGLYLVAAVGSILAVLGYGPTVESSWATFFGEVESILTGAIIALIYFSPVKEEFK